METLTDDDYRRLLAFRTGLRRYLRWAEERAAELGLTPAQHQLLLAVRGRADPGDPTVSDLAEELLLRHHSVVELLDRAEGAGLVRRYQDLEDHRVVRVALIELGRRRLRQLAGQHLDELRRLAPAIGQILDRPQG